MKFKHLLLGLVALTVLAACRGGTSEPPVSSQDPVTSVTSEVVTSEPSEEPVTSETSEVVSSEPIEEPTSTPPSSWTPPTPVRSPKPEEFNFEPLPEYTGTYYNTIDFNLRGNDLKTALYNQWKAKFVGITYSQAYGAITEMDRDPAKPNNVLSVYDLKSHYSGGYNGGRWNREHAFPQSKLADGEDSLKAHSNVINISSDIANLFACDADLNTQRSNNSYAEWNYESDPKTFYQFTTTNTAGEKVDSILRRGIFSPTRMVRGEIARSQLYMLLFYPENCSISENFAIQDMIRWDRELAPTIQRDGQRQTGIEKYQKVRNPFIDNRNLSCYIWGDINDHTRNVCQGVI